MIPCPRQPSIPPVFSPDGRTFAAVFGDKSVRLWDVATARPIGPIISLHHECGALAFRPDGQTLVTVDARGNVRSWPVPRPAVGTVENLIRRMQVRTNMKINKVKDTAVLTPNDWEQLRAEVGDAPLSAEPDHEQDWHETNARDAEALADGFGARWHLDRLIAERPKDGLLHARRAQALLWSGNVGAAEADIERAITRAARPHSRLDAPPRDAFRRSRRTDDALRLLNRVTLERPLRLAELCPPRRRLRGLRPPRRARVDVERAIARGADISFLIRIADERSRAGRWHDAAALFDRAIAMGTVPYEVWAHSAIAHLELDDDAGYRRVCRMLHDRYPAAINERIVCATLADVLILGADCVGDDGKTIGWIEPLPASVTPDSPDRQAAKREFLLLLGEVLYRLGRYREAIARIEQGIATVRRSLPGRGSLSGNGQFPPRRSREAARSLLTGRWRRARHRLPRGLVEFSCPRPDPPRSCAADLRSRYAGQSLRTVIETEQLPLVLARRVAGHKPPGSNPCHTSVNNDGTLDENGQFPDLYYSLISLNPTDLAKTVTSIEFTQPSGAGFSYVMGVSGSVPEPAAVVSMTIGCASFWRTSAAAVLVPPEPTLTAVSPLIFSRRAWTLRVPEGVRAPAVNLDKDRGVFATPEHSSRRGCSRKVLGTRPGIARCRIQRGRQRDISRAPPEALEEYRTLFAQAGIRWHLCVLHPRLEVAVARDASRACGSLEAARVASPFAKFTGRAISPGCFLDTST